MVGLDLRVRTEVLMSRRSLWSPETTLDCGEHHEAGTIRRRKDGPDGPARLRSTRNRRHWQPGCIRAGRSLIARYPQRKDKGSWAPLIEHWEQARTGLRRLASLASANSDRPHLVICHADEARLALPLGNPRGIVTLDIAESSEVAQDPTGREKMARQFGVPSPADTQVTSIIPFRDKIRSVEISLPLQGS